MNAKLYSYTATQRSRTVEYATANIVMVYKKVKKRR